METTERNTDRPRLPCQECGRDVLDDGEKTTIELLLDYPDGEAGATMPISARECPNCGEVTPY